MHRMESSSKEKAAKKKQSENVEDRKINSNGVLITVYEESARTRSRNVSEGPIKRTKPRAAGTHGYDRRALLLAHSQQLRNEIKSKKDIPSSSRGCRTSELVASKESKEGFDSTSFLVIQRLNSVSFYIILA
ncbi:hypothetical protein SESBI_29464 [Sesbania bispinosa]|nr:hypothetical protein SESBI_29464 [Sesbania bispinosa]